MKCPLLKEIRQEINKDGTIKHIEEFRDCIGFECAAYIPATAEVLGGRKVKETVEDCRMMRK